MVHVPEQLEIVFLRPYIVKYHGSDNARSPTAGGVGGLTKGSKLRIITSESVGFGLKPQSVEQLNVRQLRIQGNLIDLLTALMMIMPWKHRGTLTDLQDHSFDESR